MQRFLLFLLLAFTLLAAGSDNNRQQFLISYYGGDYKKAHEMLAAAFADGVTRQCWDNRIHLSQTFPQCPATSTSSGVRSMALLRVGEIEQANSLATGNDWLSMLVRATAAWWMNDADAARSYARKAVDAASTRPEVLFFAGDVASSSADTVAFFSKYLETQHDDPLKKSIAEFSIRFLKKTAGMQINVITPPSGTDEIEADYDHTGLRIKGKVNERDVQLMLDTGAGGLVLGQRDWKPQLQTELVMLGIGKKQSNAATRVVLNHFETGRLTIKNPTAAISHSFPSSDLDGIMSAVAFGAHRVLLPMKDGRRVALIPYDEDPAKFFASRKWKMTEKERKPFHLINKMIIIKGTIKNSPATMDMMLDTGAERSIVSAAAARKYASINYPLSMQLRKQSSLTGVGGKADNVLVAENVEVKLGSLKKSFNSMPALNFAETSEGMELELDLILGRDFLDGYTLLLDYQNRTVTFYK